jgi:hypothetical protein
VRSVGPSITAAREKTLMRVACTVSALRRSTIGAAMLAGLVCGMQPGSAQAEPLGARQRLAAATAAARAWQKDAQLVRAETRNADAQGRSPDWTYVFDSPGAKKQTLVSVFGSDKPDLMPTGTAYRRPLGDFVDSPVAMQEAVRRGLKTVAYGMSMSITGGEPAQWLVLSGDQTFVIDGATGRFLRREKD